MFTPLLTALALCGSTGRGSAQSVWGNALSFDGVNDLVVVTNFGAAMPTTAITIEFWQRLNRNQDQTAFYLVPHQDYSACRFSERSDGTVIWDFGDTMPIGGLSSSPGLLEPGMWQHFAVVADFADWHRAIYCNGVLKAFHLGFAPIIPGVYTLHLGQLNGALDDFRVWNRVRTQAEIAADMLHPLTGTEAGLVAYWKFDEAPGTTVRDSTTNQWHGYLSNEVTRVWSGVAAPNLVANPGFEQGTAGWFGFGWAALAATNSIFHSGNNSGFVSNRSNTWCGVAQPLLGVLQPGLTYRLSAWVRLHNGASAPVGLTFVKTDGNDTTYPNVVSGTATSSQWTQLRGNYTVSVTNSLKELTLYLDGPAPGVNFYVDDVAVVQEMREVPRVTTLPATNLLASGTSAAALLRGKVNPNGLPTTAWFEWGTNWRYGRVTATSAMGNGWDEREVSRQVPGLTAGLIYHYRLVASNSLGVARGGDQMFWLPVLSLNGPNPLTNECHFALDDPGIAVSGSPVAIAAGGKDGLALKADGTVVGWGYNANGQTNGTAAGRNVVAISAGANHNLALKADGTVVGWGFNDWGNANGTAAGSNVVAISAAACHSLALKADGTVFGWGDNTYGQTTIPAGLSNVIGIAVGWSPWRSPSGFSLALKADGAIVGWGDNNFGHTSVPAGLANVVAIDAGGDHSLALNADGTVVGWGYDLYGQATGVPHPDSPYAASGLVVIEGEPLTNVVAISAGGGHSLALKADGAVVGWGYDEYGQATGVLHTNSPFASSGLVMIEGEPLTNVVAITAGGFHSLALRADGTVVGWGLGTFIAHPEDFQNYGQALVPPGLSVLNLPIGASGAVETNSPGFYVLNYRTTNTLGAVCSAGRNVWVADTLPPQLTLLGANPLVHFYKASFADPGALAIDLCGGDLSALISIAGTVDTQRLGTYALTYRVTDPSGNTATTNRTVYVMTAPSFVHGDSDGDGVVDQTELDGALASYWPTSPWLQMTNPAGLGGMNVTFALTNSIAGAFSVEYSTNLVDWYNVGPAIPRYEFTDTNAPAVPQRYYRLRWP